MSRHCIAWQPYEVIVGWDPPCQTFFLEVFDATKSEDEDAVLLWLGTKVGEISTVVALEDTLTAHAELTSGATLTPELRRKLEEDQATSTQPSALQRRVHEMFGPRK